MKKGVKRKLKTPDITEKSVKKGKISSVQPPTFEELNNFRETQNVFNSNPFRSQIEELLREEKLEEPIRKKLDGWIEDVREFLLNIDVSYSAKVSNQDDINVPNILLPMKSKMKIAPLSFKFVKPRTVEVLGSYGSDCMMADSGNIDLFVEIPQDVFQKEDYLNEKYLIKRNIYLSCLASKLLEAKNQGLIVSELCYVVINAFDKPVLRLKHSNAKLQKYSLYIFVIGEKDIFAKSRLLPKLNNVRYGWYFDTVGDGKLNFPTPLYNSIICLDLITKTNEDLRKTVFSTNPKLKDAYILLKVWMRQRNLDEGLCSFSGFLLAMFIVYLYNKKKLNNRISINEIIRTVWLAFDHTNWDTDGISLQNDNEDNSELMETFKSNYEVVFLDVTGSANLASALSLSTYLMVKLESKFAIQCLDDPTIYNFQALFMKPVEIFYEFDHVICFDKKSLIRKTVEQYSDSGTRLNCRNDIYTQFTNIIIKILKRALGQRVSRIFSKVEPSNLTWSVNEKMPWYGNVYIGLSLHPEHAYNIIDKGPSANLPEAQEFRRFWGTKSELRRFKDGDVCETVSWATSNDPLQKKRLIVRNIIHYVLENQLGIPRDGYVYIADQMESVVFDNVNELFTTNGTSEEACCNIINSYQNLSKILRQVKDIPLDITSTQGTSASLRYAELFPVLPNQHVGMKKSLTSVDQSLCFKDDINLQHTALYVPAIDVIIQFSSNSKWPNELKAIRTLQTAFYIKLSSVLQNDHNLICRPHYDFLDILKDGFVFRLRISNNYEISAVKRQVEENGEVKYCDNEESRYLERKLVHLPVLTSAIHGLYQQFSAFGTACALVKRWLRSQLIDEHYFPDICVELIISYLCLNSQPYVPSQQPQTIFFRFLKLVSTSDWFIDPIIVNFNDKLSREEILDIEIRFSENRETSPTLLLITPFDKSGTIWTTEQPSPMILKRLSNLAGATLRVINDFFTKNEPLSTLKQIFRPPLGSYDILIKTIPAINSCRWLAVDANVNALVPIKNSPAYEKLPILNFHPIQSYVEDLRKCFNDHCLFFYDFYGGNCIGVLLKPETKLNHDLKISMMKGIVKNKNQAEFNVPALIEDFKNLGGNIVFSVEKLK